MIANQRMLEYQRVNNLNNNNRAFNNNHHLSSNNTRLDKLNFEQNFYYKSHTTTPNTSNNSTPVRVFVVPSATTKMTNTKVFQAEANLNEIAENENTDGTIRI